MTTTCTYSLVIGMLPIHHQNFYADQLLSTYSCCPSTTRTFTRINSFPLIPVSSQLNMQPDFSCKFILSTVVCRSLKYSTTFSFDTSMRAFDRLPGHRSLISVGRFWNLWRHLSLGPLSLGICVVRSSLRMIAVANFFSILFVMASHAQPYT